MANINDIVNVNAEIVTGGLLRREFGIGLFITTDETLPTNDSLRIYSDMQGIISDFESTTNPYKAANIWFAQEPFPKNFMVGRWVNMATSGVLSGGVLPTLASLQTISDGTLTINSIDVLGIDFTADLSFTDIANTLEVALLAEGILVNIIYDATTTAFIITTNATGASATITYASVQGTGTDLSSILLLDDLTAISLIQGLDSETIEEALAKFQELNNSFYFILYEEKDNLTVIDIANWTVTQPPYLYFAESSDQGVLITNENTSVFSQLFATQNDRVAGDYTPIIPTNPALVTDYLAVSSAARLSSINFGGTNSVINPAFKNRPTIEASIITSTQANELDRKKINRFVPVGGGTTSPNIENIYRQGYTFKNNIWQDIRMGVDWLTNAIQVSVFDLLLQVDRVPQTIEGGALIKSTIEFVCNQGVVNGLLAPGTVSATVINQIKTITNNNLFDGTLPLGYLVFPQSISTLSDQDRIERKYPPIYVWVKGSGAINFIDINLIFDQ